MRWYDLCGCRPRADIAQISSKQNPQQNSIACKHCNHPLGHQDEATDGWRIQKWCTSIASSASSSSPAMSRTQRWISVRLLYLIENSVVRKFHIHRPPASSSTPQTSTPSLLLWVFTPDLLFSSSIPSPRRRDPTRALKVFYKQQTWQPLKPGEPESATIDDVCFTEDLFEELLTALKESQGLLPPTARSFQGWDVGLLERFDVGDLAAFSQENEVVEKKAQGDNV